MTVLEKLAEAIAKEVGVPCRRFTTSGIPTLYGSGEGMRITYTLERGEERLKASGAGRIVHAFESDGRLRCSILPEYPRIDDEPELRTYRDRKEAARDIAAIIRPQPT